MIISRKMTIELFITLAGLIIVSLMVILTKQIYQETNIFLESGFKISIEQMYLPSTPKIVGYNYWGNAEI